MPIRISPVSKSIPNRVIQRGDSNERKKIISGILSAALALSMAACSAAPATTEQPAAQPAQTQTTAAEPKQETTAPEAQLAAQQETAAKAPKYVFLFIGDGMSYPQFQAAAD